MNSDVIGIFNFRLCSAVGKNDLHSAPLSVLSHCLSHFVIPSFFGSVAIVVIGILLYTIFSSPSSSAASLASLSARSLPSIPSEVDRPILRHEFSNLVSYVFY